MDLDELQSVQSRERQTDSLQQLRASFYKEAGEFLEQLRAQREQAAERAEDPWNSPEVSRLSDDIETAEQTVEAIYERRVGKVVKMASLAAADMPTEDDGLTDEEEHLFETLVSSIEDNRAQVEAVLDGENPALAGDEPETSGPSNAGESAPAAESVADSSARPDPVGEASSAGRAASSESVEAADSAESIGAADAAESVDAADLMGARSATDADAGRDSAQSSEAEGRTPPPEPPAEPTQTDHERPPQSDGGVRDSSAAASETERDQDAGAGVDRETVRIKSDVGEIYGVDDRSYDLSADDVVNLPAANATPLLEDDAAERLE